MGNRHAAPVVVELAKQLAQGLNRIVHRASVGAGVQVVAWTSDLDFHAKHAA